MYGKQWTRTDADIFMMLVVSEGTSGNIALHMCEVRSSQQRYRDQGLELCEVAVRIANTSLLATRSPTEACSCRASPGLSTSRRSNAHVCQFWHTLAIEVHTQRSRRRHSSFSEAACQSNEGWHRVILPVLSDHRSSRHFAPHISPAK